MCFQRKKCSIIENILRKWEISSMHTSYILTLKSFGFVANVKKSIWGEEEVSLWLRIIFKNNKQKFVHPTSRKNTYVIAGIFVLRNIENLKTSYLFKSILPECQSDSILIFSVTITLKTKYFFGNKVSKIQATHVLGLKFHMIYYLQKFILTQRFLELEHNLQVKRKKFPFYNNLSSRENHKSSHRESQKQYTSAYFQHRQPWIILLYFSILKILQ